MGERIRSLRANPEVVDFVLVGILTAYYLGEVISYADGSPPVIVFDLVVGLAAIGALLKRRTNPIVPAIAVIFVFSVAAFVDPDFFYLVGAPFVAMFVTLYSIGRYEPGRRGILTA